MRMKLALLALSALALATPADAQSGVWKPHAGKHHRRHVAPAMAGKPAAPAADCGIGDCRGLNSPGNMGGNKPF